MGAGVGAVKVLTLSMPPSLVALKMDANVLSKGLLEPRWLLDCLVCILSYG